jgi:nucleotide-binding universal stress UspA family protein
MKKILFPTDFSETADRAFVYALNLAKKIGASISTLHVWQPVAMADSYSSLPYDQIYEMLDLANFENFKDEIPHLRKLASKHGLEDVEVNHILESGLTESTIIEVANKEAVDLIVMGTQGASGLKEIFVGSVTGEVMENAHCPVVGVPFKGSFGASIQDIVFTVSFEEEEAQALKKVLDFANVFGSQVHCLHVDVSHTHDLTQGMNAWKERFADNKNIQFEVIDGTSVVNSVLSYVEKNDIDMVAMLTHKRSFFQELFTLSYTKKLAYHAHKPLLALQAKNL